VLAEDALHGHRIRMNLVEDLLDATLDRQQSTTQLKVGRRADNSNADEREFAAGQPVNNAEPTSG
jgi:hypothetical protein